MGGCLSRRQPSAVSAAVTAGDNVQVVHQNGHVQLFSTPITAYQVAGKRPQPAEYFLCTAAMLVSAAGSPALTPDAVLQPGKVYFMLPLSTLHPDVSPADLASMAKRLTAAAKSAAKTGQTRPCVVAGGGELKAPASGSAARSRQWRPVLDTIKEKPAINNNQSDFEDKHNNLNLYVYETNYHE